MEALEGIYLIVCGAVLIFALCLVLVPFWIHSQIKITNQILREQSQYLFTISHQLDRLNKSVDLSNQYLYHQIQTADRIAHPDLPPVS